MGLVIWGFDLSKMSWGAFGHKRMFDRRWYLRSERFVVYQIAMLTGLAAECTATYSLSKYKDLKRHIAHYPTTMATSSHHGATLNQSNIIDAAITTIVLCVLVATLFGADFFFLLFWPERVYPPWYSMIKRALAVLISAGMGVAAIVSTWVVASQHAVLSGVNEGMANEMLRVYYRPPIVYRHWAQNIAWVVLLWIAFIGTVGSTVLMFICVTHDEKYGPLSRSQTPNLGLKGEKDVEDANTTTTAELVDAETTPDTPQMPAATSTTTS